MFVCGFRLSVAAELSARRVGFAPALNVTLVPFGLRQLLLVDTCFGALQLNVIEDHFSLSKRHSGKQVTDSVIPPDFESMKFFFALLGASDKSAGCGTLTYR